MSNQVILWSMLILPWLTIFFMKKQEIKRYMPSAIFTFITSIIIVDIGFTLKLWVSSESIYPFKEILPFSLSVFPVTTLWILKFANRRFWLYSIIQLILSIFFVYVILPWINRRGIFVLFNLTSMISMLIAIPQFIVIYLYTMWQDSIFSDSHKGK